MLRDRPSPSSPAPATPLTSHRAASTTPVIPGVASHEEEQARDLATMRVAARRRFWSILCVAVVLLVALQFGLAQVSLAIVFGMLTAALALNQALSWLARTPSLYRRWLKYVVAVFDTLLVSAVVLVFGSPVLVLAYTLAIVPYSFDQGRSLGYVTSAASVAGFLAASGAHGALWPDDAAPWPQVLLAAGLLVLVSQQLIQMPSRLIRRIRRTRERMARVERGDLTARADARHDDELGFLERSFNRMLDELSELIETVQEEADAVAAVATQVVATTSALQRRATEVAANADTLRDVLATQREKASAGVQTGREARQTADATRRTADITAADTHALDDAASSSRAAIDRAAQSLLRVGTDVTEAAHQVRALAPASEQVGEFIATVSRIARQTNLLALNAAMEASRAGEDGVGFAVVADEIRALATESAAAAKKVATTVQRVRDDISAAVVAMDATASEVQGAGAIAREATRALGTMVDGIGRITRQGDEVAALAQQQARLAAGSASAFDALDASAHKATQGARAAADAAQSQRASIEELSRSADVLRTTAARLRQVALRHASDAHAAAVASPSARASIWPAATGQTDEWPVEHGALNDTGEPRRVA